jgi:hypothetical protein
MPPPSRRGVASLYGDRIERHRGIRTEPRMVNEWLSSCSAESQPAAGDRVRADIAGAKMNRGDVAQPGLPLAAARAPGNAVIHQGHAVIRIGPNKALSSEAEVKIVTFVNNGVRGRHHPRPARLPLASDWLKTEELIARTGSRSSLMRGYPPTLSSSRCTCGRKSSHVSSRAKRATASRAGLARSCARRSSS